MSIEAMKQALEALESWQKTCLDCGRGSEELGRATQPITALRQAIAEAEKQEPVAFRNTETGEFCTGWFLRKDWAKWQPLYAAPVHASDISQERVDETEKREHEPWCDSVTKLLLSMPPQIPPCNCKPKREWVGLTDEEIHEVVSKKWWDWEDAFDIEGFSRAIEAKLKEKNSG